MGNDPKSANFSPNFEISLFMAILMLLNSNSMFSDIKWIIKIDFSNHDQPHVLQECPPRLQVESLRGAKYLMHFFTSDLHEIFSMTSDDYLGGDYGTESRLSGTSMSS